MRVGVDMIAVARIARSQQRFGERFYARFFTDAERATCMDNPQRLAARIAAKEAAAKALGTGIGQIHWTDLEVAHDAHGRPHLILHGTAIQTATALGLTSWEISLSHTDEHALAFVVMT